MSTSIITALRATGKSIEDLGPVLAHDGYNTIDDVLDLHSNTERCGDFTKAKGITHKAWFDMIDVLHAHGGVRQELFLDNSNILIGAQRVVGKLRGLLAKPNQDRKGRWPIQYQDNRVRYDVGGLLAASWLAQHVQEREYAITYRYVAGSRPPPTDSVWKKMRAEGWKTDITDRSVWDGRESEVDHSLITTLMARACLARLGRHVFSVLSGDIGYRPAL
jgi:hypothetical protein